MNRRMMNLQSTIATRMEETPRTSAVFMRQCKEQPQRGQVWTCGSQAETYCTHALPEVPRSYRNFAYSALAWLQDGDVWVGVFPEGEKSLDGLRYSGSPILRIN